MPVTIKVASHDAVPVQADDNMRADATSQALLERIAWKDREEIGDILETLEGFPQTSLPDERLRKMQMYPRDHGLIRAAFTAYSHHQNLVLRPEDIWFAILAQFSFYVNKNAEKLRRYFVPHNGKKGLILKDPGQPDMSVMCRNMTKLMDENVVDPELREWILPSFSTTKVEDETIAAVLMMGTLQSYFEYIFDCSTCGIPSVTLLGEREDWEDIARRIEKLEKYGEEPARFGALLKPILREMVASFDVDNVDRSTFWSRIVDHHAGSGMETIDGWITCFAFWNEEGKVLAKFPGDGSASFQHRWFVDVDQTLPERLRDVRGPELEFAEIPCGFVSVPVLYVTPRRKRIEAKLLAGFAGFEAIPALLIHPALEQPAKRKGGILWLGEKVLSWCRLKEAEHETEEGTVSVPVTIRSSSSMSQKAETEKKKRVSKESTPSSVRSKGKESEDLAVRDTLRPVTAWWMFRVKNPKGTGNEPLEKFYERKLATDWEGGVSVGEHIGGGRVNVRQGL